MARTQTTRARADDPEQLPGETASEEQPDAPSKEEASSAPDEQPPGVYEYVHGIGCTYPHVPLTCRAYHPAVPGTDTAPPVPEQPATVFEWLDGPPADGRWAKTRKRPNQAADNAGGLLTNKE
ncbi:hypothetical protein [Streptomyces sp. NPDC046978]|uniref:hypothetical protein n=1 Tax=Streptomyces sp. NPDC046978 TaxID=3154704 RepID=UPI0033E6A96D